MNLNRFLLFLSLIDGVGDTSLRKLIFSNCFKNLELENLDDALIWIKQHASYFYRPKDILSLTINNLEKANDKRKNIEMKLAENNISYITYFDESYPFRGKTSDLLNVDAPIILYYKGNIELLNNKNIAAVIGSRNITEKGKEQCIKVTNDLVNKQNVILSGLALGCDTVAHETCLNANGKTIAILGSGLDSIYPAVNKKIAERIITTGGLLISEYAPGFKATKYSLVQRDRLQTMFSDNVYVIQTDIDGGTMHAALATKKYGKKLYVVDPSLLEPESCSGNIDLINKGYGKAL